MEFKIDSIDLDTTQEEFYAKDIEAWYGDEAVSNTLSNSEVDTTTSTLYLATTRLMEAAMLFSKIDGLLPVSIKLAELANASVSAQEQFVETNPTKLAEVSPETVNGILEALKGLDVIDTSTPEDNMSKQGIEDE